MAKANLTKKHPKLSLRNTYYEFRKYRILEFLNQLPRDRYRDIVNSLPSILGVTRQTLSVWMNISINDDIQVPSIDLWVISCIINIPMNELINDLVKDNSTLPIAQVLPSLTPVVTGLVK